MNFKSILIRKFEGVEKKYTGLYRTFKDKSYFYISYKADIFGIFSKSERWVLEFENSDNDPALTKRKPQNQVPQNFILTFIGIAGEKVFDNNIDRKTYVTKVIQCNECPDR